MPAPFAFNVAAFFCLLGVAVADRPVRAEGDAARMNAHALAQFIDREINGKLEAAGLKAASPTDDAEFLRRAHLDITGVIPSYEQALAFLDSTDPERRAKLIDRLLADPGYSRHMAHAWAPRLFLDTSRRIPEPMLTWLQQRFQANQPWNELVADIVTASGTVKENGATTFFQGNNTVADVTEATARAFLGVQLQCAQCHNHPFTSWSRSDYWAFAAFYTKVNKYTAKRGVASNIAEGDGARGLSDPPEGFRKVAPRFLDGKEPQTDPDAAYRPALAAWLTAPENPFFAHAFVNRTWAHFFGRGLVNPVDDMIEANPPSHPRLLEELTRQFVANDFDVRYLVRAICNSSVYQRSSRPLVDVADRKQEELAQLFGLMAMRSLTPRQLEASRGVLAGKAPGNAFLKYFETREELDALEYHSGIPQTLMMMNSMAANLGKGLAKRVVQPSDSPARNLERLCLHVLSRRPTIQESQRWTELVRRQGSQTYEDLVWAWLLSAEFQLNR